MSLARRDEYLPTWANFVNSFFNDDWYDWSKRNFSTTNSTLPSVNIKEEENVFIIEMAAPGMEKDDFKIELNNSIMTISSEKKSENESKDENYSKKEFSYQSFSRSFNLPTTTNKEDIHAKYEKGILVIEIPKKEEEKAKPVRRIEIS